MKMIDADALIDKLDELSEKYWKMQEVADSAEEQNFYEGKSSMCDEIAKVILFDMK